jgi:serine/threonine protein kinase
MKSESANPGADSVERIFNAALALSPADRQAYLTGACGKAPQLRQRVETLLHAHESAQGFLPEEPRVSQEAGLLSRAAEAVAAAGQATVVCEKPGDLIGRYKVREKIGEGGCGVVFIADQEEPVRRRVALKVIKPGMDTRQVIARFEAERQALALMDHPNIAKVFDAGATQTGRPYFVMELVRGIKITQYCDEHSLSARQRLDLFVQVCRAIQHAHQKGIIHRDIKPSNVLVTVDDGIPVPKVIDFGIAKATAGELTNKTVCTALEQILGTPAYMSPEQALMTSPDVDTRSDIYSLGVLLYELLTGETPFAPKDLLAAGLDQMRRTIREQEPLRPSTRLHTLPGGELAATARRRGVDPPKLMHLLKGDLDWIVMKCLEKDRIRRYETANDLAADLGRFLGDEPVVARPPSRLYRFRKQVRRNKVAFTGAAAFIAALVVGIVSSTWEAARARKALSELREAAPSFAAEAQALIEDRNFTQALQKVTYAVSLRPEAPRFHYLKGNIHQSLFQFAQASREYARVLEYDPNDALASENLLLSQKILRETKEAAALPVETLRALRAAMLKQERFAEAQAVGARIGRREQEHLGTWQAALAQAGVDGLLTRDSEGALRLSLSNSPIRDLAPLRGLPLTSLSIVWCTNLTDLAPLQGMSLRQLAVAECPVSDLTPLKGMPLVRLNLNDTRVSDIRALKGMPLEELVLSGTGVSDISPLQHTPLGSLNLWGTHVTDISALEGMVELGWLGLSGTPVSDLRPLQHSHLGCLTLDHCQNLHDLSPLAECTNLDRLTIPRQAANIDFLRRLPLLKYLSYTLPDHHPDQVESAADFWRQYDAEKK